MTTHALAAGTVMCPRCGCRPGEGCLTRYRSGRYRHRAPHVSRWRLAALGPCPFCDARQGEPCRTAMGTVYPGRFHRQRE